MRFKKSLPRLAALVCALAALLSLAAPAFAASKDTYNYQPSPDFGTYLGMREDSVFEFEITIPDDEDGALYPLVLGPFSGVQESSDPTVVSLRAQYLHGHKAGTATVEYKVYSRSYGIPHLKAIAYVTVVPKAEFDPSVNVGFANVQPPEPVAATPEPTPTPKPAVTPAPSATPTPPTTPAPTPTPEATVTPAPTATPEPTAKPENTSTAGGPHVSGSTALPKLSQQEIAQLLRDNPLSKSTDVFDVKPSLSSPYAPGKVKDSALQAALNRLNALRRIAGLPSVVLDDTLNESAQYGAVLLAASTYGHYPPQPADMSSDFYQTAYAATSSSNINGGEAITLTKSVDSFMNERNRLNTGTVGHRRWQLNPTMGKVGFGYVADPSTPNGRYVDQKAHDKSGAGCDYDFIGWPASGNFPSDLFEGDIQWSVTLNPAKYQTPNQSQLKVTLTRQSDGKTWTFSGTYLKSTEGDYFNVDTEGYGVKNCIVFRPDGVNFYEGTYTVKIDGLKTTSGQAVTDFEYEVNFFNAEAITIAGLSLDFTDVSGWCREAVSWAVYRDITNGTSPTTFSPDDYCTQAQILTFLWRAAGEPTPSYQTFSGDEYYTEAINWAFTCAMIGKDFNPNAYCTRADAMKYIWRVKDGYYHEASGLPFTDLPAQDSLSEYVWAVEKGITNGTSPTTFSPNDICTRGQIVTFLHRAYVPSVRLTGN